MRREWEPEELIACWTLLEEDRQLLANKSGATRLGFALLLKYLELEGRFPRTAVEVPKVAVDYVAQRVTVPPEAFGDYQWSGRTIEYHRAQVRKALGFREATVDDRGQARRLAGGGGLPSRAVRGAAVGGAGRPMPGGTYRATGAHSAGAGPRDGPGGVRAAVQR